MSLNIDLLNAKESNFELIPPGTYYVMLDEASVKDTKAGTGQYINCKFKIVGGEYDDRFIFHTFNIANPNPKAVEIGIGQLKTFLRCAGQPFNVLTDVNTLLGLRCDAIVKTQADTGYGEKATISYFKPHASTSASGGTVHPEPKSDTPKLPF